jgi:hypothetical protein
MKEIILNSNDKIICNILSENKEEYTVDSFGDINITIQKNNIKEINEVKKNGNKKM